MDPAQAAPPQQPSATPDPTNLSTDSGRNLEAAVPAQTPLQPADSHRRNSSEMPAVSAIPTADLAEPAGTLQTPAVQTQQNPRSSTYLPTFPADVTDPIDRAFEHLLVTVRANRPADDLDVIRSAWQFCMSQH